MARCDSQEILTYFLLAEACYYSSTYDIISGVVEVQPMRASILLSLFVLSPAFVAAQTTSQANVDGSIRTHIEGIDIPPIANAPFSGKVMVTWDEPLIGGGTVSRKYYTLVARDAQGRVHRETRDFVPADSTAEPPLRSLTVIDPVAGTRTKCTQAALTCTTSEYHTHIALTQKAGGPLVVNAGNVRSESLGTQTMDTLTAVGTRETSTTVSGPRVILSHTDLWYSPDLQMYLSVARNDPQLGQLTLTVTDLVLGSPDHSWFDVPPGYVASARRTQ